MQIKAFRVTKYRNIEDSGRVEFLGPLTCVVGKNQSGKSALLRALHKFNPHRDEPYDMRREWPRGQRTTRNEQQVVCEVHFDLTPEEATAFNTINGDKALVPPQEVSVNKSYAGDYGFSFPGHPELFPNPLDHDTLEMNCQRLPKPTDSLGEEFFDVASELVAETEGYIREGSFENLERLDVSHKEKMEAHVGEGESVSSMAIQHQFISDYSSCLTKITASLTSSLGKYKRAYKLITQSLPTFIYMEDYKTFRGRASLVSLRERQAAQSGDLSEEEETFLMILKLAGLDLDQLIEQGNSDEQDEIHDRQLDLQDAAMTLTKKVAGRWGQNEYEVQFRVDARRFLRRSKRRAKT